MNIVVVSYAVYLLISVALTVWVGRTLYKNGAHFLVDVFTGNTELAGAVNHLLVVGFYLINFGYVTLTLKMSSPPVDAQQAVEALSLKIGAVLIALGVLHLANIFVFNQLRKGATAPKPDKGGRPPVFADAQMAPRGQASAPWLQTPPV